MQHRQLFSTKRDGLAVHFPLAPGLGSRHVGAELRQVERKSAREPAIGPIQLDRGRQARSRQPCLAPHEERRIGGAATHLIAGGLQQRLEVRQIIDIDLRLLEGFAQVLRMIQCGGCIPRLDEMLCAAIGRERHHRVPQQRRNDRHGAQQEQARGL